MTDDPRSPKAAEAQTRSDLDAFADTLPPDDGNDAANVARGFIATRVEPNTDKLVPNAWLPISWGLSYSDFVHRP